jgi:pilus assembly protein FimV
MGDDAEARPDIMLDVPGEKQAKPDIQVEPAAPAGNLVDFNFDLPPDTVDKFKRERADDTATPVAGKVAAPALDLDLSWDKSPDNMATLTGAPGAARIKPAAPALDIDLSWDKGPSAAATLAGAPAAPDVKPADVAPGLAPSQAGSKPGIASAPMSTATATPREPAVAADLAGIPDIKLDHIDLSFDETPKAQAPAQESGAKGDHWYDIQTKFDLAKAYQEMGDRDGAREILEEVVKEGDAGQQAEAKQMLASLG